MALQKSLMEQSDITETLRGFELVVNDEEELIITNPQLFNLVTRMPRYIYKCQACEIVFQKVHSIKEN